MGKKFHAEVNIELESKSSLLGKKGYVTRNILCLSYNQPNIYTSNTENKSSQLGNKGYVMRNILFFSCVQPTINTNIRCTNNFALFVY